METSQYLHSIPTEYNQPNMLFPPNYDFHEYDHLPSSTDIIHDDDDGYMDTLLGIEEALLADSPQRETPAAGGGEDHHYFNKLSLSDLLLLGAEAVESENWHLASATLARLDQNILIMDTDTDADASPFLRLAHFFAQGLRLRALGPRPAARLIISSVPPAGSSSSMSPYQMVQELSPYAKFAHFTANQAILEACGAGEREVHVVDFDVMEGLQWPPLMVDLARRGDAVSLRITAVVADSDTDASGEEVRRTGRRLVEFAGSVGLMLEFDHLHESNLDELKFRRGSVVANCVVHPSQMPSKSLASARRFVSNVCRKLSPKMVVLVQEELFSTVTTTTAVSFVEFFCEALRHFSSVSDSLASSFVGGGYRRGLRLVEEEILGPRIVDCVGHFPCGGGSLGLEEEGFKMVPLSPCNVSQAKFLVGLFSRGYGVQHSKERLALCWKSTPLTTASIWVPNQ